MTIQNAAIVCESETTLKRSAEPPNIQTNVKRSKCEDMSESAISEVTESDEPLSRTPSISSSDEWSYRNQVILAPMVRVGTLPMRLLAAKYGATMVYNEELIDYKVVKLKRTVNEEYGTIDYMEGKKPIFRTRPGERVAFQLGTADAVRALRASEVVARDVRAIDVNMGCPKHFSVAGGMGSALLRRPEKARDILTTLKRNLNLPITCKIRILEDPKETIQLAQTLEHCGIEAMGVHSRYTKDRPRDTAHVELVRPVVDALNIPVIYNGDVFYYKDIATAKRLTGRAEEH
eukprot:213130_1